MSRIIRVIEELFEATRLSESLEGGKENMYAIILTGGKQYKVEKDTVLKVESLNVEVGSKIKLDVLMLNRDGEVLVGDPIEGAYAEADVTYNGKGRKINIFKYKAKKNVRKRQGHRQPYTELKITNIVG